MKAGFENVAHAFLELLAWRGVDCFFANAGTDFASIVDAFAHRLDQGKAAPRPLAIPHEIPLVSMAHGYYLATGKPQAAMVHVGVGTANSVGGLMTAYRSRIPILFCAGRTPVTEVGYPASRSGHIHWGQESFDQASMVREYVKWDYELRTPAQIEDVLDRAMVTIMSEPKGPAYLTLPREILASPLPEMEFRSELRYDLPTFHPDPAKTRQAADLLAKARSPLVVTSSVGRNPRAVRALVRLAEEGAVGVISHVPDSMNFPYQHPCYQGHAGDRLIESADLVLVVDCDVPWYPKKTKPPDAAVIVQVGIDPLFSSYPIRSFPSDLTLQGDTELVLSEIAEALAHHPARNEKALAARRQKLQEAHDRMFSDWRESGLKWAGNAPLDDRWVALMLNDVLDDETVVINEYGNAMTSLPNYRIGGYFGSPRPGHLGWGLGAALGMKLGSPDRTVIATLGDGCYIFSVPSACHSVSSTYHLPILVIVYNNRCWEAVKRATLSVHPDGWAARKNHFPLSELHEAAHYEKICEAFGGYGERVESPEQFRPALERALYAVKHEKRQALLNVTCKQH